MAAPKKVTALFRKVGILDAKYKFFSLGTVYSFTFPNITIHSLPLTPIKTCLGENITASTVGVRSVN